MKHLFRSDETTVTNLPVSANEVPQRACTVTALPETDCVCDTATASVSMRIMNALQQMTQQLHSCPPLLDCERIVLECTCYALGATSAWIARCSGETFTLDHVHGTLPLSEKQLEPWNHYVFEQCQALVENHVHDRAVGDEITNLLVVPLFHHHQPLGVVGFCTGDHEFNEQEIDTAQLLLFHLAYRLAHGSQASDELLSPDGFGGATETHNELFIQTFRCSSIAQLVLRADTETILSMNPAAHTLFGEKAGISYHNLRLESLFTEQNAQQLKKLLSTCVEQGESVRSSPVKLNTSTRADRVFSCTATPMRGRLGRIQEILCVFTDITEQQHLQQEVTRLSRLCERRVRELRAILDTLDDSVLVIEAMDNRLIGNGAALRWFPELFDTLFQEDFAELLRFYDASGEPIPSHQIPLIRALHGERIARMQLSIDTAEGRHWFRCNALPVNTPHGGIERAVMVLHDIPQPVAPSTSLTGSPIVIQDPAHLVSAIEQCPFGILIAEGKEPIHLHANSFARTLFGGEVATILRGYEFSTTSITKPLAGMPMGCSGLEVALLGAEGEEEIKVTFSDKERVLRMTYGPIFDEAGRQYGAIAQLQDVTEERNLERAKEEFLCITSHELQTPLTVIKGYTEQLLWAHQQQQPLALDDSLRAIERQVARMHRLIADLLDVSTAEINRLQLEIVPINLNDLLLKVINDMTLAYQRRIESKLVSGLVIQCDPVRIEQIMRNILENAFKYSATDTLVEVSVEAREYDVEIVIRDQGEGIPANEIPQLFVPFYRTASARKMKPTSGFGLGLALCYHLVRKHGGKITVESAVGVGSAFHIVLPR